MPTDSTSRQLLAAGPAGARERGEPGRATRSFDTTELFGADTEIEITHNETVYRLKITRQGKLILNK